MNNYLLVFAGGGIGSVLRLGVYRLARLWLPAGFPWGTLAVNVLGGLLAGLLTGWLLSRSVGASEAPSLFLMTGVLGGFTTFSAFGVDAVLLFERGDYWTAALYVLGSVALAIVAVIAGIGAARALL